MTVVTALVNGGQEKAYLSVNAKAGRLELRDANLEVTDFGQNAKSADSTMIEE